MLLNTFEIVLEPADLPQEDLVFLLFFRRHVISFSDESFEGIWTPACRPQQGGNHPQDHDDSTKHWHCGDNASDDSIDQATCVIQDNQDYENKCEDHDLYLPYCAAAIFSFATISS